MRPMKAPGRRPSAVRGRAAGSAGAQRCSISEPGAHRLGETGTRQMADRQVTGPGGGAIIRPIRIFEPARLHRRTGLLTGQRRERVKPGLERPPGGPLALAIAFNAALTVDPEPCVRLASRKYGAGNRTMSFGKSGGGGRRGDRRVRAPIPALLITMSERHSAELLDISQSGARLRSKDPPGEGTELFLQVGGVDVYARVAWQDGPALGLVFETRIDPWDVEYLRANSLKATSAA